MAHYIGRRLVGLTVVLIVLSALTFLLIALAPGDAATAIAERRAGPGASAAQVDQVREALGLDDPIPVQYARWLAHALRGDLGVSVRSLRPIGSEIVDRLGVTIALAGGALALVILVGIPVGIAAGVRAGGWADRLLRLAAIGAVSVPSFVVAYVLIYVVSLRLGLVPTLGGRDLRSFVVPWIVLALPFVGALSRVVRSALVSTLGEPFVTTGRSKGLSMSTIVVRDALPNAAIPILAVLGAYVGQILAGTVVVETIFSIEGLGLYLLRAVAFRDIPALQACVLLFAVAFVLANLAVDLGQAFVDPRIRDGLV